MHLLVFGASVTQGAFDEECGGWVNRLAAYGFKLSAHSDKWVLVFNLGISGDGVIDLRARIENEIQARIDPSEKALVLISIGINDSKVNIRTGENKTSPELYEKTLREIFDLVLTSGHDLISVGITPVDQSRLDPIPWNKEYAYRDSEIVKFTSIMERISKEKDIRFVPMLDILGKEPGQFLSDGVHPNTEGHRRIFERVKEYLEKENIL